MQKLQNEILIISGVSRRRLHRALVRCFFLLFFVKCSTAELPMGESNGPYRAPHSTYIVQPLSQIFGYCTICVSARPKCLCHFGPKPPGVQHRSDEVVRTFGMEQWVTRGTESLFFGGPMSKTLSFSGIYEPMGYFSKNYLR